MIETQLTPQNEAIGTGSTDKIANALTIDVEDYFQVSAFAPYISRDGWNQRECRVERNVDRILALLSDQGTSATFFILGWIAERYPALVRRIAEQGHEIASHGYGHQRASDLSRDEFLSDILMAKCILEDLSGAPLIGYRAPSFSIGVGNLWAFDCLAEAGYRYSSSVYPIQHDHYGMPDSPRFAYVAKPSLIELPVTTVNIFGKNLPASGGGYFRLFPFPLSRWMMNRVNQQDAQSGIFYFHPWEIDANQPRVPGIDSKTRFRHYVNISKMEEKLIRLLKAFHWGRVDHVFEKEIARGASFA
jgi:polysaccharide deacetylase family protein (PEP-CTERM system associated)